MSLTQRRALYVLIVILFPFLGAVSIQFATGHRYDLRSHRFVKVGALYIKSYPSGASVVLDGKETGKRTPTRLLNIIPGEHTVTVTRAGFAPWVKKLMIASGETAFARDIVMFRSNPRVTKLSYGSHSVLLPDDRDAFAFLDAKRQIHLTSTAEPADFTIGTQYPPEALLALSPQHTDLAYTAAAGIFVLDVNTESSQRLRLPPATRVLRAQWDSVSDDVLWLLTSDRTLLRFDGSNALPVTVSENIDDFFSTSDRLITLVYDDGRTLIQSSSASRPSETMGSIQAERRPKIHSVLPNGAVLLLDEASLWLLAPGRTDIRSFEARSSDIHGALILFASEFEISIFDTDAWVETLLDRSSQPIDQVAWHPSGSYFIRQQSGLVELVEIDARDRRNTIPLLQTNATSTLTFDRKGERLFILHPAGSSSMTIQ